MSTKKKDNFTNLKVTVLIIIIFIALVTFSSNPYQPNYSIYNEDDLGASKLRESLEYLDYNLSRILLSPIILSANKMMSMIIIIGSERAYSAAEIDAYENFVNDGGALIIFEDFGPARKVAERFGITFFPGVLKETQEALIVNRPSQFFIQELLVNQLVEEITLPPLMVSEAAGIIDLDGILHGQTIPLLLTYPSAFIDVNDNDILDRTDLHSPVGTPVGLFKEVGNGTLVVISDASIPLNQYWLREATIADQKFTISNALWTTILISMIAGIAETGNIVFDESHQAISVFSAAGMINLMTGTWISLINTITTTFFLGFITVLFTSTRVRKRIRLGTAYRWRTQNIVLNNGEEFISNPTLEERSISEQYILFNVMKDNFVQAANTDLINKIIATKKGDEFLNFMKEKYGGKLTRPLELHILIKIHNELREFVRSELTKWL
jgi:hypothetical protein